METEVNQLTLETGGAWRRLRRAFRRWSSALLPYRPIAGGRERLDRQYSLGEWEYLGNLLELPRFGVVVAYARALAWKGSILEIGCGEGLLLERLSPEQYTQFLGVDISTEAIRRAADREGPNVRFEAADAAEFRPPGRFDTIIFNESLEYFAEPLEVVRRYESFLEPDGVFIVSVYDGLETTRNRRLWKMLDRRYQATAHTRLTTHPELSWDVKVMVPRSRTR